MKNFVHIISLFVNNKVNWYWTKLYKLRKIYYIPKICHPQKRWLSNLHNVRSLSYYI